MPQESDPILRPIVRGDLEALDAIESDADLRFGAIAGLVLAVVAAPESVLWEALEAGLAFGVDEAGLVGFVYGSVVDDSVFVEELSVRRSASGRRLGSRLLDAMQDAARARGLDALTLTTFREVPWNAPYYRRLGFVEVEPTGSLRDKVEAEIARGLARDQRVAMRRALR